MMTFQISFFLELVVTFLLFGINGFEDPGQFAGGVFTIVVLDAYRDTYFWFHVQGMVRVVGGWCTSGT